MNTESKYDIYGCLKTEIREPIKDGDKVEYINSKYVKSIRKIIKETFIGIWLNGKVRFTDSEKTVVRTTKWLIKHNEN